MIRRSLLSDCLFRGEQFIYDGGYAKDADDIGDVRKFVEYISYPGNPPFTRQADEDSTENSDQENTDTSNPGGKDSDSSDADVNALQITVMVRILFPYH